MSRSKFSIVVYAIIALGVIGFVTQFFANPFSILKSLLMMVVVGIIVFALIYFLFLRNRTNTSHMRKYNKAVKQSQLKYQNKNAQRNQTNLNRQGLMRKRKNKNAPHLRVIEGNKSKRRNRATF